jgi:hypothetical protein
LGIIGEGEYTLNQWHPQPPPQQLPTPPLPEKDLGDFAEVPLAEPFEVAKTESWSEAFLLAHLGQAISCCLFKTIFSNCVWQSSQTYS